MLRGELSNRPQAIVGIDYRILLEVEMPYGWFLVKIPELLLDKRFENLMRKNILVRDGAADWLESNWERRFATITVGCEVMAPAIDMILGDFIAESYHFATVQDFRSWLRVSKRVLRIYTNDPVLLGLDEIIQPHSGWAERI